MNKFIAIGRLTRDPELSTTNDGTEFAKFGVALQRNYKNRDGEYEADFLNCIAWRKTAELIGKYTKKGDRVGLVGRIQTGSYEAQDGTKRYTTDFVVEEIEFLTPKNKDEDENKESDKPKSSMPADLEPIDGSDLPF